MGVHHPVNIGPIADLRQSCLIRGGAEFQHAGSAQLPGNNGGRIDPHHGVDDIALDTGV